MGAARRQRSDREPRGYRRRQTDPRPAAGAGPRATGASGHGREGGKRFPWSSAAGAGRVARAGDGRRHGDDLGTGRPSARDRDTQPAGSRRAVGTGGYAAPSARRPGRGVDRRRQQERFLARGRATAEGLRPRRRRDVRPGEQKLHGPVARLVGARSEPPAGTARPPRRSRAGPGAPPSASRDFLAPTSAGAGGAHRRRAPELQAGAPTERRPPPAAGAEGAGHRLETPVGVVAFDYDGRNTVEIENVASYRH